MWIQTCCINIHHHPKWISMKLLLQSTIQDKLLLTWPFQFISHNEWSLWFSMKRGFFWIEVKKTCNVSRLGTFTFFKVKRKNFSRHDFKACPHFNFMLNIVHTKSEFFCQKDSFHLHPDKKWVARFCLLRHLITHARKYLKFHIFRSIFLLCRSLAK